MLVRSGFDRDAIRIAPAFGGTCYLTGVTKG